MDETDGLLSPDDSMLTRSSSFNLTRLTDGNQQPLRRRNAKTAERLGGGLEQLHIAAEQSLSGQAPAKTWLRDRDCEHVGRLAGSLLLYLALMLCSHALSGHVCADSVFSRS
jgi:hypothetical protein